MYVCNGMHKDYIYKLYTQGRTDNEIKINLARECSLYKEKQGNHSPL